FTEEAVASGAIIKGFQEEALRCDRTVLLETGPGHSTRCADTPYAKVFREEERRLARLGLSAEDIRLALEDLNLGRLRIASKGIKVCDVERRRAGSPRDVHDWTGSRPSEPTLHYRGAPPGGGRRGLPEARGAD